MDLIVQCTCIMGHQKIRNPKKRAYVLYNGVYP